MPFMKAKEKARREKVAEACRKRNAENREKKLNSQPQPEQGTISLVGRRIVELALLARDMWCEPCSIPLSFRFLEEEKRSGLSSTMKIRCMNCLTPYHVSTSSKVPVPATSEGSRSIYAINCKAALGSLDTGIGHEQLNKFLSVLNLPTIHRNTIKLAEGRVSQSVFDVAKESCDEAIAVEKLLTLAERTNKESTLSHHSPESTLSHHSPESTLFHHSVVHQQFIK